MEEEECVSGDVTLCMAVLQNHSNWTMNEKPLGNYDNLNKHHEDQTNTLVGQTDGSS